MRHYFLPGVWQAAWTQCAIIFYLESGKLLGPNDVTGLAEGIEEDSLIGRSQMLPAARHWLFINFKGLFCYYTILQLPVLSVLVRYYLLPVLFHADTKR